MRVRHVEAGRVVSESSQPALPPVATIPLVAPTARTGPVWPAKVTRCSPERRFQTRTVPSPPALTTSSPSGVTATAHTDPVWPVRVARCSPERRFQTPLPRRVPRLLAYAKRRLDTDDAHDAVSETMARAVNNVSAFQSRGVGFDAWLYGILRHVIADVHRRSIRRLSRALPPDETFMPELSEGLLVEEEAEAVRWAFERLAPADQEILELRVVRGLTADEVGSIIGKRPGAVRMGQSRALERLRTALERRYADR